MYTVIQIPAFSDWHRAIKDRPTQVRLMKRLRKAQLGNLGDVKQVGSGDKSTQSADIAKAISLANLMEIEHD